MTDLNLSEIIQDSIQSFEPFFVLDEKKVYKTTCLKTISSKQKLSKDRLRRVQGMSTYPCENSSSNNIDSFLLNGDPVLVNGNDGPKIANVVKITKSNQTLKQIDIIQDNKQMKDIELTLKFIDTKLIDGETLLDGHYLWRMFQMCR